MSETRIKVLYVDDEMQNLVAFKALFRRDFDIFTASGAKEGLNILEQQEIHVIITDQRMPGIAGVQFLERAIELYPDVPRMILTGYSDIEAIIDAINKTHIYKCLSKPWNSEELTTSIKECYQLFRRNKEIEQLISKHRQQEQTKEHLGNSAL